MSLTGATFPLVISGKEFAASIFCDKDYDELTAYIQSQIIRVGRIGLEDLLPSERSEQLQATIKAASSSGWGTPEGAKIINTSEGALRVGWQMIRKTNPKFSFESFVKLAKSKGEDELRRNIESIDIAYMTLNFSNDESNEDAKEASSEENKSN